MIHNNIFIRDYTKYVLYYVILLISCLREINAMVVYISYLFLLPQEAARHKQQHKHKNSD